MTAFVIAMPVFAHAGDVINCTFKLNKIRSTEAIDTVGKTDIANGGEIMMEKPFALKSWRNANLWKQFKAFPELSVLRGNQAVESQRQSEKGFSPPFHTASGARILLRRAILTELAYFHPDQVSEHFFTSKLLSPEAKGIYLKQIELKQLLSELKRHPALGAHNIELLMRTQDTLMIVAGYWRSFVIRRPVDLRGEYEAAKLANSELEKETSKIFGILYGYLNHAAEAAATFERQNRTYYYSKVLEYLTQLKPSAFAQIAYERYSKFRLDSKTETLAQPPHLSDLHDMAVRTQTEIENRRGEDLAKREKVRMNMILIQNPQAVTSGNKATLTAVSRETGDTPRPLQKDSE